MGGLIIGRIVWFESGKWCAGWIEETASFTKFERPGHLIKSLDYILTNFKWYGHMQILQETVKENVIHNSIFWKNYSGSSTDNNIYKQWLMVPRKKNSFGLEIESAWCLHPSLLSHKPCVRYGSVVLASHAFEVTNHRHPCYSLASSW